MTGYPRKIPLASLLLMSMHCTQAFAEDEALPGAELLEFLAEWEAGDGHWVDPVELDEPLNETGDEPGHEPIVADESDIEPEVFDE